MPNNDYLLVPKINREEMIKAIEVLKDASFGLLLNLVNYQECIREIIDTFSLTMKAFEVMDSLAYNQIVLTRPLPIEMVERFEEENINILAEELVADDSSVGEVIAKCDLDGNLQFEDSVRAFYGGLYNVAILGFVAVLDKVLSETTGKINTINIKKRVDDIKKTINEKGEIFLYSLEGSDAVLINTYIKAFDNFKNESNFSQTEPDMLNRNWLMHGRTTKKITRMDCVKVLYMIYGTIRMAELGKLDLTSDSIGSN